MKNHESCKPGLWVLGLLGALVWAVAANAQTVSGTFKVVCIADRKATDITHEKACRRGTQQLTFGSDVTLAVEHAPEVTFDDADEPNPADLLLFLDGKALPGTHPAVGLSQTDEDDVTTTLLTYHISHDLNSDEARKNWKEVLAAAQNRQLTISTGLENGPAAQSRADPVQFTVVRTGRLLGWGMAAAVGLLVFYKIAVHTGALRDKEPAGTVVNKPTERAYSLSRVQMALWTMLTIYAYLFIWFLTGEYKATIPASVVGLMGITLTTFAAVDASKVRTNKERLQEVAQGLGAAPRDPALVEEKAKLEQRTMVARSEGFFRDITTSAEGASLHRLQFIVWTLALTVVFVITVWRTIAMPDFDATLLGLMGITSGAYVGLKVPEEKT